MIPIKIQCGCGQRYAFEVEAVAGRMPYAVACPVCGVDGTDAADAVIASSLPGQPVSVAPKPVVRLHSAAPAAVQIARSEVTEPSAPLRGGRPRGPEIDRVQAEHEARAKVLWGDSPEDVVKFLMIQGLGYEEASALVQPMFHERAKTIRTNGIRKIVIGSLMACVPIVAFFIFNSIGVIPLKIFAVTVMVGLWGAYMVLKGIIMMVAPKSEPGDVATQ